MIKLQTIIKELPKDYTIIEFKFQKTLGIGNIFSHTSILSIDNKIWMFDNFIGLSGRRIAIKLINKELSSNILVSYTYKSKYVYLSHNDALKGNKLYPLYHKVI